MIPASSIFFTRTWTVPAEISKRLEISVKGIRVLSIKMSRI